MRIFALSDLHLDFHQNKQWLKQLSAYDYQADAFIIAGDICHNLAALQEAFRSLRRKFSQLFFVPGNHDLWVVETNELNSLQKFQQILALCMSEGITTTPGKLGEGEHNPVWVVPLFSWYVKPEEGEDSLYKPKPGEDPSLKAWSDNYLIKWPSFEQHKSAADYFLDLNQAAVIQPYDAPVISFSHFLPRQELIYASNQERKQRQFTDRHPSFNFSRVAGSKKIDLQLRQLGSKIHIYGHQHRNRIYKIDGVLYISYGLRYPSERPESQLAVKPRLIWDTSTAELNLTPTLHDFESSALD